MSRATIIEMVPLRSHGDGDVKYMDTGIRRYASLGAATAAPPPAIVTTAANVGNLVNAANAAIPTGKITVQSDFSKVANVVATGAATVAAVAAVIPVPPVPQIIAAVAGVVAGAAALLGRVFANSPSKALAAERGQYEQATAEIQYENQQLDQQYVSAQKAINDLKVAVSSLSGIPYEEGLSGFAGICLWNCQKEKAKLSDAKSMYEAAQAEQNSKTAILAALLDEYNKLVKGLLDLKSDKGIKDWMLWLLLGTVVVGGVVYAVKK